MAKRGAEAVAFHAPWESFVSPRPPKRGRSEPGLREPRGGRAPWSGGGCKKRKRAEEDEETSGKRPPAVKRGRPHEEQHQDDVWHYNSFQYWRPPLPAIDLSDILDLEKENMVKTRLCSRTGLSEMET
ncbi:uncharacterized protein C9orf40 homolog isoform X2 [Paroedura picta]|uniref:uncharacterized protein C9orf40 homolog isoform X2 n=1 Tax=Paroedura picta TaxID=143630 RepID=UPI0040577F2B